jgi:dolichol-phosphate mannosyltransferase
LFAIGLLGEYVARIYEEAKGRPLYVVSDTANLGREPHVAKGVVLPSVEDIIRSHEQEATRTGRV